MKLLSGMELWDAIRAAAHKSSRVDAAVAFVGKTPDAVFRWPKKILLVTAISEGRVRSGATSAKGTRALLSKGARIGSRPDLHAKIYVFDKVAFVGSANASESSTRLLEAAVKLTEPTDVRAARRLVGRLWRDSDPVDDQLLASLAKVEPVRLIGALSAPTTSRGQNKKRRRWWSAFQGETGVWIDAVSGERVSKEVEVARAGRAKALADEQDVERPTEVVWTGEDRRSYRRVPAQDWIFVWWEPTNRSPFGRLEGPLRCLGGCDLGKRFADHRYARAESDRRSRTLTLDGAGVATLSSFVSRARVASSQAHARHLHDRVADASGVRLKDEVSKARLAKLLARLS